MTAVLACAELVGIGFTWEHDLHLYLRRARANSLLYGDSRYHREVPCSAAAEATCPDQAAAIARDCDDVRRHPCPQSIREKGVLNGAPRRGRGPAHALDFAPTASRRGSSLRWRVVLVAIGVVAVAAVVVTAVQGHKTAAIAIGLLTAAFFCGMAC